MLLTKDLFISYGRRESLGFVGRLHQQLRFAGYEVWFDKVNIPDGEDYAERIHHGIETAHNFAYVMAPRCLISPYCLMELEYARLLGKRVIPLNQMVIFQTDSCELSAGDQAALHHFYMLHGVSDPDLNTTQAVLNRSLALIGRTDWLDAKEYLSTEDCIELATWAQGYENHWHKHDNLEYLKTFEFPVFGKNIDSLASIIERMQIVLERHKQYVQQHTNILLETLTWERHQRLTRYLLVGKERLQAEDWLLTDFVAGEQPPCQPTDLQCEFICESHKNSFNMMTHAFICYDVADKAIRNEVVRLLARHAITTWRHDYDIQEGSDFARAIEYGIETADNFLYFLSPDITHSDYCRKELEHALQYHKRIIPLLIVPTPEQEISEPIRALQYLDFTQGIDIDALLKIMLHDQAYYEQHKVLLVRALKWQQENHKPAFLLRGYNLSSALIWLRLNQDRLEHPPTEHHHALITTSEAAKGQLGTEVFISYSRKDGDFARQLNLALQAAGKPTWFDQESISSGVDFEREIFKGIDGADNFIFIISPDAVGSPYCEREVNYASGQCKRFISLLWRTTAPTTMPPALQAINWIDFQNTPFEKVFPELIQTIDLDREHAHQHTVLQQRASDWVDNDRSKDFLLNNTACENAERWQATAWAKTKQPAPTPLQQEFIQASRNALAAARKAEHRRRNIILTSVTAGLIIAIILSIFSWFKMREAKDKTKEVLKTQSLFLSILSNQETDQGSATNGILMALEGLPKDHDRPYVMQADDKLYKAVLNYTEKMSESQILIGNKVVWSPNGKTLATIDTEGEYVYLWDSHGQLLHALIGHEDNVLNVHFSPDGQMLATTSDDKTVRLWAVNSGKLLHTLAGHEGGVNNAVFSPDGQTLATTSDDKTARLWAVSSGQVLHTLTGHQGKVVSVVFSPDSQMLATASMIRPPDCGR
ncbi:MAG: TIR domain-containing protein [Thioploca sp.]|nr:TIR domain-containing protein [Thioploca sp.]